MNNQTKREVGLTDSSRFLAMEDLQETQRIPSISPINLNYFGMEACEPGHRFGPFIRTSYLLHFVLSGKGTLTHQGQVYPVRRDQAFLIYPGEENVYQADQDDPWVYAWTGFHGLLADTLMESAGFAPERPVKTIGDMEKLDALLQQLLARRDLSLASDLARMGYFYEILSLLVENNGQPEARNRKSEDAEDRYVQMAVNLLINSGNRRIRVEEVADAIGISRGYLTSIFKKKMKVSPQQFLTNYRMETATDLLEHTDSTVSLIAHKLGYADSLSFSKCFHRHFGVSPTEFRERRVSIVELTEKGQFTSAHPL